jgi:HD superfamily phosphohydrolase
VIHDAIWGTHQFFPHEIAIIDSPILQRLRRIYQTGFAFLTFPSTSQTRFEHSLGATIVGTRMLEAVARRHPSQVDLNFFTGDLAQVRAACLLHDCGHGFASHVSEQLYRWHPAIRKAQESADAFRDAKASEIIAWHIVTSPKFRKFLAEINERCKTTLEAERIANLILGIPYDPRDFVAEVLNGPFDVDRVDYIVRDSDYSGMKSAIDLERFFYDIDISVLQGGTHLVLRSTHAIEQLLWTKVHLFVRLYRHQKVLAADGAVQSLVSIVQAAGVDFNGADFSRVSDYLRTTDTDILDRRVAHDVQRIALGRVRLCPQGACAGCHRCCASSAWAAWR